MNEKYLAYDLQSVTGGNPWLGLWRLMTGFRLRYLAATLFQSFSALARMSTYMLLRVFVDDFVVGQSTALTAPILALGFLGLALVEGGSTFLSGRLAAQSSESITRRLRNYLYDHIQHLSFNYHDKTPTGDLIERVTSDVDAVRRFYSEHALSIGRITLIFTVNFIALLQLNTRLALLSIIIIPAILLVSFLFFRKITRMYEAYQEQEAVLTTTLQENLSGVRIVKAFARQNYEIDKFETENREKYRRGIRLNRLHALFWPITDVLCGFQMVGGFYVAALMVMGGEITIGSYLAYVGLIVWIIFPMRNLGRLVVSASTGLVSFGRIRTVIAEPREPLDEGRLTPSGNLQGNITFHKVGFDYQSGENALQDISFSCRQGQVVALLGSTGSGKTTIVNLLPRFYEYTRGNITLDGVELSHYPRRYLRQQIGIVEQESFLFSRSIYENITYGVNRKVTPVEVEEAARVAAIHEVIQSFPQGYQTMVGEKGVTLSGGQKQRVAIARTLLKNPSILILDDSTSSVDSETESEIRSALQDLMRGRTTFVIAHRIQSVMEADLILVLDKGSIIQCGKHLDLIKLDGPYRRIFEIQTRIETELEQELADVSN